MPSDPTGRYPIGVLARPAPDFFDDGMAAGTGVIVAPAANQDQFWTVALYNNASTGQVFKVYGLSASNLFGGGVLFAFVVGTIGAFDHTCASIRSDQGMPYGQIYTQQTPAVGHATNPLVGATPIGHLGTAGESFSLISPFPLYILAAGQSLVAFNGAPSVSSGNFLYIGGVTFWYQVANE